MTFIDKIATQIKQAVIIFETAEKLVDTLTDSFFEGQITEQAFDIEYDKAFDTKEEARENLVDLLCKIGIEKDTAVTMTYRADIRQKMHDLTLKMH